MKTRFLSMVTLLIFASSMALAIGAHDEMLSDRLRFDEAAVKSDKPVTLVLTPEFLAIKRDHKIVFHHYVFSLGQAIGANLRRALEANYKNVVVVDAPAAVKTKFSIEPKFYAFDTKLPGTVFGTYTASLKLGFLLRRPGTSSVTEHVEDVVGTEKRSATHVLFLDADYNANDKRLGIAANDAVKFAIDDLIQFVR
jgi:hypothetical protein